MAPQDLVVIAGGAGGRVVASGANDIYNGVATLVDNGTARARRKYDHD